MLSNKLKIEIYKYAIKTSADLEALFITAELILEDVQMSDNDFIKQYLLQ